MKIRIWGARGSIPSPLKPQDVEEKIFQAILGLPKINTQDPEAVRAYINQLSPLVRGTAGGNTSCVEVQAGQETFIIDSGSGIHALSQELMRGACGRGEGTLHLLFTHPHWDHLQGFPFFLPAFVPGNQIYIYSVHDIEKLLRDQQRFDNWPIPVDRMPAHLEFIHLEPDRPFSIGGIRINLIENVHPGKAYSFRFEDGHSVFVHASDAEYKQLDEPSLRPYLDFFHDADVLIFDAQFTQREAWEKVGWGHSSSLIGADLARRAGVKRLVLFHHDPTCSDEQLQQIQATTMAYQAQDPTRPTCEVMIAYEGLTIDLTPPGAVHLHYAPGDEVAVLAPTAHFDERGVNFLTQQLARLDELGWPSSLIVDLSRVESLTMAGLKSLVSLRRERPDTPVVLAEASPQIRQVIELAGFLNFFTIYPSVSSARSALQVRETTKLAGQLLGGRYLIETKIGNSLLGSVFRCFDTHLKRTVAIKILSPSFSTEAIDQFLRQAAQIREIVHDNIVHLYDYDEAEGLAYVVEEFVAGPTLQDRLEDWAGQSLSMDEALDIGVDIALALEYAHSHGVVHGDLKPKNVILNGRVKLTDFGLGRLEQGHNLLASPLLVLTAAYLAPEQILGQPLDARTDLYALGVILYELFTGRRPFEGDDLTTMEAHLYRQPLPPRELNPHISLSLEHLILKLLAKNPNERYASAQQVHRISSSLVVSTELTTRQHKRPLIGRAGELDRLLTAWDQVQAGRGQLIFIEGEAGIGKTHLAQAGAAQTGATVILTGHCSELIGSPAYQPFIEALSTYFAIAPPEFLDEDAAQLLGNFAQLIPYIRQMLPDLPVPSPLEPKQEQLRLMTSLALFIKMASQDRPWVLILDDLQGADQSSLELLHYLGRHTPSMSLLLIGIYRDMELDRSHPLRKTLWDLDRHPTYHRLTLDRLTEAEVGQFLTSLWQEQVPQALVEKIYQRTQGNPFYVEEVARGLVDDGLVTLTGGGSHFPTIEAVRLPQSVRAAVLHRLNTLSRGAQELLYQAAVLGQTFRFEDLCALSNLSEREALEGLDVALERHLIQESPGQMVLRFTHPEIQHVLYENLGTLRRRMLHRQAGEAMERRYRAAPGRVAEELAHHFIEAGEVDKAVHYSLIAAQQAQATYANQTALMWYQRALETLSQPEAQDQPQLQHFRPVIDQALGEVLALLGRYEDALNAYHSARSFMERQTEGRIETTPVEEDDLQPDDTNLEPGIDLHNRLALLCYKIADIHVKRGEYDLAFGWLENGLNILGDDQPLSLEAAQLYMSGAKIYQQQAKNDLAVTWSEKSLQIAAQARSPQERWAMADIFYKLSPIYRRRGDVARAIELCNQSIEIYVQASDFYGQSQAYLNLANAYSDQGDWTSVNEALQTSLAMKQTIGDIFGQGVINNNLANVHLGRGEWAEAVALFETSLAIWNQIGTRFHKAVTLSNLAQVYIYQEHWDAARDFLNESQRLFNETGAGVFLPELERRWGEFYLKTNQLDQALVHMQQSIDLAVRHDDPLEEGRSYRLLGQIHLARGKPEEARAALRRSLEILNNLQSHYEAAKTTLPLIRLSLGEEEVDKKWDELDQAITTFKKLGAQADLAEALSLEQELDLNRFSS